MCKEVALNELNLLFLLTTLAGFPHATTIACSLMTNGKPVNFHDGKTLKVVLCTKFCPACDKQVIASVSCNKN